jgi:hypothetical protein
MKLNRKFVRKLFGGNLVSQDRSLERVLHAVLVERDVVVREQLVAGLHVLGPSLQILYFFAEKNGAKNDDLDLKKQKNLSFD